MRRENLPDGGHDKVISKRRKDHSRDKASWQRTPETWWRRTTATLSGGSFGSYRRCRRDVLMGRRGYILLRRLGYIPLRHRWVFDFRLIWDVKETYWWDVVTTSSWDVIKTYQWDVVKTYHWDVLVTFHCEVVGCFIWDVPPTLLGSRETSLRSSHDVLNSLFVKFAQCRFLFNSFS